MENICCHIVGAGDFSPHILKINEGDVVIACDGGYRRLKEAGIGCHYCIGDFDSLGNVPKGDFILTVLPTVKDVTDTHAACQKAISLGFKRIKIYGGLGGDRFSHSLANLQLLANLCREGYSPMMVDEKCTVIPIENGEMVFSSEEKGYISVFAFDNEVKFSCQGLKYNVTDRILTPYFALGVSNEFTGEESRVKIDGGVGIIITEKA